MKRLGFMTALMCGVCAMPCLAAAQTKGDALQLEEVIVTASRHAENIQRSALSIQAVSGSELSARGVYRPEDLNRITPGVTFGTGANYPQTYVRGVGNFATNSLTEAAIAANIDGVYVSRPWQQIGAFFDIDRVEVLKGPQGTLYGRNASGGAINLISVRPRIDGGYSGFAELEVGNFNLVRGAAAVNLPINEMLAARISTQIIHRDGYLSGGGDDDKGQALRVQLLYQPKDNFSVLLHASYQHQGGVGGGVVVTNPRVSSDPWAQNSIPEVSAIYAASTPVVAALFGVPGLSVPANDGFLRMNTYELSSEIQWDFGPATLTVIPAFRGGTLQDSHWAPGFNITDSEIQQQTSLEARLSNEGGPLKWVVGAYYFKERQSDYDGRDNIDVNVFVGPPFSSLPEFLARTESYAAFGQGTYSLTERLRLTLGARYTLEKKHIDEVIASFGPPTYQVNSQEFTNASWKGGVEYDLAPQSLAYVNASTGFKSGGFFGAPPPFDTFKPEKLTAYEAGVKNRFFGDTLQVNVEAFYWKYRDQQTPVFKTLPNGFFTQATENAGQAHMAGANFDIAYRLTANDTFRAQVEYVDTKYDSFLLPFSSSTVTGCPISAGVVDCSGQTLIRTPKWNGTVGYIHTFDLGDRGSLDATVNTQFASGQWLGADFLPEQWEGGYSIWDVSLTYHTPDKKLSLTGYVRNLTDEAVLTQTHRHDFIFGSSVPFVGNPLAGPNGLFSSTIRPPRTYGVMLHVEF